MGAINREWHRDHRMPDRPTDRERGRWHAAHQDACACRAPSERERDLIAQWRGESSRGE
ncbi:hypothetical protein Lsed01_02218 [Demequina sediminis]|uniref:HNH endonuclease n=1 Tax=Demequina sediminis TaxID=1930058 RepID=A0ABP9WIU5_9MICO|nr:hypothetical protein [Demequina sediminis]BDZ60492.1 hypothetical protein GCM10025873_02830 [Demequina sediminis]